MQSELSKEHQQFFLFFRRIVNSLFRAHSPHCIEGEICKTGDSENDSTFLSSFAGDRLHPGALQWLNAVVSNIASFLLASFPICFSVDVWAKFNCAKRRGILYWYTDSDSSTFYSAACAFVKSNAFC